MSLTKTLDDFNKLLSHDLLELFSHSSIALSAIATGEELNRRLEILIKAFLLDDHTRLREMFSERGSLGTFYSRIEMAAALGIISNTERHDLNLIRQIRNDLAHHPLGESGQPELSFKDEKIKSRCAQLKLLRNSMTSYLNHGFQALTQVQSRKIYS